MSEFKVIDMHCDTITRLAHDNKDFRDNDGHISLKKLQEGNYLLQCFAIFINQKWDIPAYKSCVDYIDKFKQFMKENSEEISQVTTIDDIELNDQQGKISALLTIEGGEAIEGSLEKLENLYHMGVRMMTLTWNFENEIGYPNYVWNKTGDQIDREHGLKPFGLEVVNRMQELGMIVDVSHLSDAGTLDVLNYATKPIVASHSDARAVYNVPRNLPDDMIQRLARNGGIMGINYCPEFVSEREGEDQIPDLVAHIKHIVNVGGIDTCGLGSDFDGIPTPVGMSDASKMGDLYQALREAGFTAKEIDKIFYQNFLRVFKANQA